MVMKCANPLCVEEFHYFRGRLYNFARKKDRVSFVERFWLCSSCAKTLTLHNHGDGQVRLLFRWQQLPSLRDVRPFSVTYKEDDPAL